MKFIQQNTPSLVSAVAALGIALVATAAAYLSKELEHAVVFVAAFAAAIACIAYLRQSKEFRRHRFEGLHVIRSRSGRSAIYDRETGLCASWYFGLQLQEEIVRSRRSTQPFALLVVEGRRGKRVVSARGRKRLLTTMSTAFRASDLVGRLGELQFAALLLGVDQAGAQVTQDRILSLLPRSTVNVRYSSFPKDGSDARSLFQAAGVAPTDEYGAVLKDWHSVESA